MSNEPERIQSGRYVLLRRLGEGSQGETFEARDNGLTMDTPRRPEDLTQAWQKYVAEAKGEPSAITPLVPPPHVSKVAIKRFRIARAKGWKDVELAEREARTLASLKHPRLPRYIDHFEEDGALYLVMEMIDGESLASIRSRRARFDVNDVTRMLQDLAEALAYLHSQAPPVVHRDIKPGNVIRRADGSFALVDFGSVRDRLKPAGGSTVVGTFGYMAPEQFQGRAAPSSDVYAVGATALAMLTGQEPEDLPHQGLAIDVARAVPPRTPKRLVAALQAMLEPDPDRRARSIGEALALLEGKAKRRRDRKKEKRARREEKRARRASRPEAPSRFWVYLLLAASGLALPYLTVRTDPALFVIGLICFVGAVASMVGFAVRRRRLAAPASKVRVEIADVRARIAADEPAEELDAREEAAERLRRR